MKCISVYTNNFEVFSEIYEQVLETRLGENEEREIDGIVISESGEVPDRYLDRMKDKPGVVVLRHKDRNITILQHGELFEILLPEGQSAADPMANSI